MGTSIEPGTMWHLNLVRNRIGNEAAHVKRKPNHWRHRDTNRWGLVIFE